MDGIISVIAAPSAFVTLAEAKTHLEIDHSDRDAYITSLIGAACGYMDGYDGVLSKAIMPQSVSYAVSTQRGRSRVDLPLPRVTGVTAIDYYDTDNAAQSAVLADYDLTASDDWAFVEPKPNGTWPDMFNRVDALKITYTAGYADIDAVPDTLKHAALLLIGHWYQSREQVVIGTPPSVVPYAFDMLVNKYKIGWAAA